MERSRAKVEPVRTGSTTYFWQDSGDPVIETEYIHDSLASKISICVDVSTPNFSKRKAAGEIINNPCQIMVTERTSGSKNSSYRGTGQYPYPDLRQRDIWAYGDSLTLMAEERWGPDNGIPRHIIQTDVISKRSEAIADAKLKALAAIEATPYNFMEDLLELRSNWKLLGRQIEGLKQETLRMRKHAKKRFKELKELYESDFNPTKAAADVWLTYRLIILPIVLSISDTLEASNLSVKSPTAPRLTARGYGGYAVAENSTYMAGTESNNHTFGLVSSIDLHVRAGILYSTTNPLEGFRFKYGLRNKDIPVGLWNVVPLSFMVDRVFNISRAIKGLLALADPHIKIEAAWVVTKEESRESLTLQSRTVIDDSNWNFSISADTVEDRFFVYNRTPWSPVVNDLVPTTKWKGLINTTTKLLDTLALSHNILLDLAKR